MEQAHLDACSQTASNTCMLRHMPAHKAHVGMHVHMHDHTYAYAHVSKIELHLPDRAAVAAVADAPVDEVTRPTRTAAVKSTAKTRE